MFTEIFTNTRTVRNSACILLATTIHSYTTGYIFSECPHFVYLRTYVYKSKILPRCDVVKYKNFATPRQRSEIRETYANLNIYLFSLRALTEKKRINQFFITTMRAQLVKMTPTINKQRKKLMQDRPSTKISSTFCSNVMTNNLPFITHNIRHSHSSLSFQYSVKASRFLIDVFISLSQQ